MKQIIEEIRRALSAGFFYLAIATCLTLPDICAALESENGKSNAEKYKAWLLENMGQRLRQLTPEDFWNLRNGVLHQGKFGHPAMPYSGIIFSLPTENRIRLHNNLLGDKLNLDAKTFCEAMLNAVSTWLIKMEGNAIFSNNIERLVGPKWLTLFGQRIPVIA